MNLKRIKDSITLYDEFNSLLAEEFIASQQYRSVARFLQGTGREDAEAFFLEAAEDELNDHAASLLKRMRELGYTPKCMAPSTWDLFASVPYAATADLSAAAQVSLNVDAESAAISHYKRAIQVASDDPTTQDLFKRILADEEEHLTKLNNLLSDQGQHESEGDQVPSGLTA